MIGLRSSALTLSVVVLCLGLAPVTATAKDDTAGWLAGKIRGAPPTGKLVGAVAKALGHTAQPEGFHYDPANGLALLWTVDGRCDRDKCEALVAAASAAVKGLGDAVAAGERGAKRSFKVKRGDLTRLRVETVPHTGGPKDGLRMQAVVRVADPVGGLAAALRRWPVLGKADALPAYLTPMVDKHLIWASGSPLGAVGYWSFALRRGEAPLKRVQTLIAAGERHGFACEDKTEDPTTQWIGSFQACSSAHMSYQVDSSAIRVTLQMNSGVRSHGTVASCSHPRKPVPARTLVKDVPVRTWHLAHVDGIIACFRRARKQAGHSTQLEKWQKIGNFLRRRVTDAGVNPVAHRRHLAEGTSQGSFQILHTPYSGSPAFGQVIHLWAKRPGKQTVSFWMVQEGGRIESGGQSLAYGRDGVSIWAEPSEADPAAVLASPGALRKAVAAEIRAYRASELEKVSKLTTCERGHNGGCDRVDASPGEKARARAGVEATIKAQKALLASDLDTFYKHAKALYPFGEKGCKIPLPRPTRSP